MRRPLPVVLARFPFKRPFLIGVAALLLVGLVGAGVWWQVGAHASPARVNLAPVVSAAGDPYSMSGSTGASVNIVNNAGCSTLDSNNLCTGGVWTRTDVWTHVQSTPAGAQWIWPTASWDPIAQGTNPVTFTKQFTIPANALQIAGQIQIAGDNSFDLQVNGQEIGADQSTQTQLPGDIYTLPSSLLHTGSNVITATVANLPGGDAWGNPAGLAFHADVSYIPDDTAPATTASLAGKLGSNGWYRSPVTLTLQATDPDDTSSTIQTSYSADGGATWIAYSTPVTFASDGQYNLQFRSVDQATNLEATQSVSFKIDQTNPLLNMTAAPDKIFDVCGTDRPVRPTFAPSDATSGLDGTQGDTWTTPSTATGAGVYTYTAKATDMAGNTTSGTHTYKVQYGAAFTGPLSPFKADQPNSFTLGATIPLKFQIMCNGTPISTTVASLSVKQGTGTAATTKPKKLSTVNTFAYDTTAQQYQLNVSTGSGYTNPDSSVVTFAAGTWTFTVTLDDGTTHDYTLTLA